MVRLGERFWEAARWAADLHGDRTRKGRAVPYVSHLLEVAGLVLADGGDEEAAVVAVLHDAVEDVGGEPLADEIRRRFGDRVADAVLACSDTLRPDDKEPWPVRKHRYLDALGPATPREAVLVGLADKLANVRSILTDLAVEGPSVMTRFNAPPADVCWYYREAHRRLAALCPGSRNAVALAAAVDELERTLAVSAAGA